MSWFKKILRLFQVDDKKITDDSLSRRQLKGNSSRQEKSIEGRVMFQYPKGQFRFPVIPDQENLSVKNNVMPRQKQIKSNKKNVIKPHDVTDQVYTEQKKKPFRPTILPPPLYGIKQQPEGELVEYELSQLLQPGKMSVNEMETSHKNKMDDCLTIESEQLLEDHVPETVSESSFDLAIDEEILSTDVESATRSKLDVDEYKETELSSKESAMAEGAITKGFIAESLHIKEDDTLVESRKQDKSLHTNEDDILLESSKQPKVTSQQDADLQEEATNNRERHQQRKSKKKHIPFNVMMLKEDKRKLAERKRRMASEKLTDAIDVQQKPLQQTAKGLNKQGGRQCELAHHQVAKRNARYEMITTQKLNELGEASEETGEPSRSINKRLEQWKESYHFPDVSLLQSPVKNVEDSQWLEEQQQLLDETLKNFHVKAKVVNVTKGPSVTRFEVQPEMGVKVSKITNLTDDIKLSLAACDIRIEAPIPGKHTVGIEVPNKVSRPVLISEIIDNEAFEQHNSPLSVALGLDISGKPVVTDLRKMPHGLIAGATGSGKSVCINTMIVSLLYRAHPNEVKLLLIDPKMVELAPYNRIPHLISPVITDIKAATAALKWAVDEMERRYQLFAHEGVRDITRFNQEADQQQQYANKLPYIVIIIDELADLMMMSPADVEEAICRIAQKARACGIHLIIATQRPSVDVITGLIKANVPTRIAFSVSSQVDSRTIIDIGGAERLLGRGDMLFLENGAGKPIRLQGTFVSDDEIDKVVAFVREQQTPNYLFEQEELLRQTQMNEEEDELFYEACAFIIEQGTASTSSLQRRFRIGYNRAARLIDMMEQQGLISESRGSKPRDVFMTEFDLERL